MWIRRWIKNAVSFLLSSFSDFFSREHITFLCAPLALAYLCAPEKFLDILARSWSQVIILFISTYVPGIFGVFVVALFVILALGWQFRTEPEYGLKVLPRTDLSSWTIGATIYAINGVAVLKLLTSILIK